MKKTIVLAMMALAIVALPATAQSRKDKKAAKKAEWEMQQQQKAEEAALLHQMKMDSIRDAQAAREATKVEEARKKAEEARKAEEAEQLRKQYMTVEAPCQFYDNDEWFYVSASKRFDLKKKGQTPAVLLRSARRQMFDKLAGKYQQVTDNYFDQMETEDGEYAREHIESAGRLIINQMVNELQTICQKETPYPDAEGMYTMYMAVKASKKELLEKIINEISKDEELNVRFNEKKFRDSAFEVFKEDTEKEYNEFSQQ